MKRLRPAGIVVLGFCLFLAGASRAAGSVTLEVEVGFDGAYRAGAWTPIFLTVSSPTPRLVTLSAAMPHDRNSMTIQQQVTAAGTAATYQMLAPIPYDPTLLAVTASDARSGRRLSVVNAAQNIAPPKAPPRPTGAQDLLIVYAGERPAPRIQLAPATRSMIVGAIDPKQLCATAVGLHPIDVLVLGGVDLARLDGAIQQAIINWVTLGGVLVCWPGDAPQPAGAPLMKILPAEIGEMDVMQLPAELAAPGPIAVRRLALREGAESIALLNDSLSAAVCKLGSGKVILLPVDVSRVRFRSEGQTQQFWGALLKLAPSTSELATEESGMGIGELAGTDAEVPDAGFPLRMAPIACGLMFILGPVDWLILRWARRRAWTAVTLAGWAGTIAFGAVAVADRLRGGETLIAAVELLDQADENVAAVQLTSIWSRRGRRVAWSAPAEGWWRPVATDDQRSAMAEAVFHQTSSGNAPISVRPARVGRQVLRCDSDLVHPPVAAASLAINQGPAGRRLVGTITNLGDRVIRNLLVVAAGEECAIAAEVAPGTTVSIDAPLGGAAEGVQPLIRNAPQLFSQIFPERRFADDAAEDMFNASVYATCDPGRSIVSPSTVQSTERLLRLVVRIQRPDRS